MSLTVTCETCTHPTSSRQIVQWRMGSCRDCCDDLIARHQLEYPGHVLEIRGRIADTPFGASQQIRRLFGSRTA